ncbi:MAG: patatin family protein [Ruminococcus sp.]|jgi:predicted patatin/cPLA2 family phospholipase|nr:patatin family protein [Ruminococcus sp.]MBQ7744865.1 patatin family protein [Ruminococcus sp.]MDO4883295.1 patatin family protein [Oscillospiraceae bacterium]
MNIGLVLEGGAMRGLFTAGVMDVLMEYGAEFDAIVGVSAGAAFGVNYKSKQIGRVIRYNKRFANDKRYCSVQSLLNTGNLFNAMFCYHTVPNELDKFDRERYNADKTPFYVVCTDAETGEPVYHLLDRANDWGFEWIRASASMPLVSKPVKIDGKYYLDGGMSDSIPIEFMIVGGCEKNVVVLTQPRDYVKEKASMLPLMKLSLRKYPYTYDAILHRHIIYNDSRARVFQEEKLGNAVVICPKEKLPIDRVEHDPEVMEKVYQLGRQAAEEKVDELRAFFNEAKR